jgi:hypothetical protein
MRVPIMPAATTAAMTISTPITGQALLPPVLPAGAGSGRALPAAAEPNEERVVLAAWGVPVGVGRRAGGGVGVRTGVGGGGGVGAGVGGISVAAIAVNPTTAVSAAAVFVGPIVGAWAATGDAAEVRITTCTTTVPMRSATIAIPAFTTRVDDMTRSLTIAAPPAHTACSAPLPYRIAAVRRESAHSAQRETVSCEIAPLCRGDWHVAHFPRIVANVVWYAVSARFHCLARSHYFVHIPERQ